MDWIIYYDDGSTFSSEDGTPQQAPGLGVVCIADMLQGVTCHGSDWYYWNDTIKQWWQSDIHGLVYQLCADRDGHIQAVKQAACVTNEFYHHCMDLAFKARTK